ncbi:hypothetical protein HYPSUDRAFT_209261 [Hypholoma sublateritium FD-334 SS-4]|uniref:Uncharacterized protein n=1 Tax=Hypholoma sublateritium (strain FD-334 SS-4) TaxID=945553 RepID=A0A0D2NZD1_HYPSF|nr:hypothetical protein HYPSUDRAFT_209261 [Hypholoma sublateritium FD-334 SS-4]
MLTRLLTGVEERRRAAPHDGPHSTGRGGRANITALPQPTVEQHEQIPVQYESTGRGGSGNFLSDGARSKSNIRS